MAYDFSMTDLSYPVGDDTQRVVLQLQNAILKRIARGEGLDVTCRSLCEQVEQLVPGVICSVLTVDRAGRMHPLAGPSLPESYSQAIDGAAIGPLAGSCGTAAYFGTDISVADIATDPRWADFKHLVAPLGLRGCWSSPISNPDGVIVATFAFYYREARGPTAFERVLVEHCLHLCLIAIDRHNRVVEHERRAFTDTLTELPNRAAFNAALADIRERAVERWALFVLDLDNLKVINDTFGHPAGDAVLRIVGQRIAAAGEPGRTFRVGGDEFALILESADDLAEPDAIAQRILDALGRPADCGGQIVVPRATIGGAVYIAGDPVTGPVRQNADFALYHAKDTARGSFVMYSAALGSSMTRRLHAIRDVSAALCDGRIEAYYQPIFRLDTREIVGLEALCRMRIGDRIISAAAFHEATSDARVSTALTERMMGLVAADIRTWLDLGLAVQHVGINVSSEDLSGGAIARVLASAFERHDVSLEHVILEVTETVYMGRGDQAIQEAIRALRDRGIRVALDDFGTGFASLTHLLTVPVDVIKIDKTFVDHLEPDSVSATIVEGLIRVAKKMGIRIVAEGIESDQQIAQLRAIGCVLGQGYVFSPAVDRDATTALLAMHGQREARRVGSGGMARAS